MYVIIEPCAWCTVHTFSTLALALTESVNSLCPGLEFKKFQNPFSTSAATESINSLLLHMSHARLIVVETTVTESTTVVTGECILYVDLVPDVACNNCVITSLSGRGN